MRQFSHWPNCLTGKLRDSKGMLCSYEYVTMDSNLTEVVGFFMTEEKLQMRLLTDERSSLGSVNSLRAEIVRLHPFPKYLAVHRMSSRHVRQ